MYNYSHYSYMLLKSSSSEARSDWNIYIAHMYLYAISSNEPKTNYIPISEQCKKKNNQPGKKNFTFRWHFNECKYMV